jgi:cytochrome c-type biogenesis protein CcmH
MTFRSKPAVRVVAICAAIFLLAGASLWIPVARAQKTDHAKQLGMKLMCMCGCAQVLVQCNHINCPSSAPMLKELDDHIALAQADDMIVQDFVQEYGAQVLSSPPNSGFNRVAWLLPAVAFSVGLALVVMVINQWRRRPAAAAPAQSGQVKISSDAMARARERVDRETEE